MCVCICARWLACVCVCQCVVVPQLSHTPHASHILRCHTLPHPALQLPAAAKAGIKPQRLSTVSDQLECCVHDEYRGTSEQYDPAPLISIMPPDFNTAP